MTQFISPTLAPLLFIAEDASDAEVGVPQSPTPSTPPLPAPPPPTTPVPPLAPVPATPTPPLAPPAPTPPPATSRSVSMRAAGGPTRLIAPPSLDNARAQVRKQMDSIQGPTAVDTTFAEYLPPAFTARPQGEADYEAFLFQTMVSRGSFTPAHISREWGDIQRRKSTRVAARAEHAANLIRERHRADLSMRNATTLQQRELANKTYDRLNAINLQEAELQMRAREFNANARNMMSVSARTAVKPFKPDKVYMENVDKITSTTKTMDTLTQFGRLANLGQGWGDLYAYGVQPALSFAGVPANREFERLRETLRIEIMSTLSSKQTDSNKEGERLARTIPRAGADPETTRLWVQRANEYLQARQQSYVDAVNQQNPGYGDRVRERLRGVQKENIRGAVINNRRTQLRRREEFEAAYGEAQDALRMGGGR